MAEGSGGGVFFDPRQFAYLPHYAKTAILICFIFLTAVSGLAVAFAIHSHEGSEFIVVFLSVCQTAVFGLVFTIFVVLARQDNNRKFMVGLADKFFEPYLLEALSAISIPSLSVTGFEVSSKRSDIFGREISLIAKRDHATDRRDMRVKIWVGLNVYKIIVIYFVPCDPDASPKTIEEKFSYCFGGLQHAGHKVNFERTSIDGESLVSIWYSVEASPDFLMDPGQKLFWAQDIAMGTESFLRTAERHKLALFEVKASPGPL